MNSLFHLVNGDNDICIKFLMTSHSKRNRYHLPMSSTESTPSQPEQLNFRFASFQHRLGALVLDVVLMNVTFLVGWIIWSFIVWGEGQTPAKKILKIRTLNATNGRPASWGHMAIREYLVPMTVWIATIATSGIALVAWITIEIVFYFTKNSRTLRDLWVKTAIVNEA